MLDKLLARREGRYGAELVQVREQTGPGSAVSYMYVLYLGLVLNRHCCGSFSILTKSSTVSEPCTEGARVCPGHWQ